MLRHEHNTIQCLLYGALYRGKWEFAIQGVTRLWKQKVKKCILREQGEKNTHEKKKGKWWLWLCGVIIIMFTVLLYLCDGVG